jgi:hypothetical protein
MATTELSQFRGNGTVRRLVLASSEPGSRDHLELSNVTSAAQIERAIRERHLENWRTALVEISCDFSMQRHDDATFNRVLTRLRSGLVDSPLDGLVRKLEVTDGKIIRASIELTGARVPEPLNSLKGWANFEFKSLRTLFQFKSPQSEVVDEELHERIRHVLRNLARHFHRSTP